jgi:hypothetical protein
MSSNQVEGLGVIPTVYSLVYPETRAVFEQLRRRDGLSDMYERAWTKQQDPMHHDLLDTWCAWTGPRLSVDWSQFPNRYVASGSSEALRDSIARHAALAIHFGRKPRIHVFAGEYEGFAAYAEAHCCEVVRHRRPDWRQITGIESGDRFYVSAPSSIDGQIWHELGAFADWLQVHHPQARLSIDLCYVGCVASPGDYRIPLDKPCIDQVFFSLSKVFGVYYHRIGGVFSRDPLPGLYGNVWFKNLLSLRLGVELMNAYSVDQLPRRYRADQEAVVASMRSRCGAVTPADVLLLAVQRYEASNEALRADFSRSEGLRYCLTPALDARLKGAR